MSRCIVKRLSQLALLSMLIVVGLGASDSAARFDKDSHSMMCVCGCNQLLGECNHVGCPDSDGMRKQLAASIARGDSDDTIFRQFQQQYGPVVLAAPMFTRFNHLAWIMPPLVLFLGIAVTMLIVRKWKLRTVPTPAVRHSPAFDAVRDRVRRETQL
jgi:cytochrome c-type biogenesis protein CcmH/NrfF